MRHTRLPYTFRTILFLIASSSASLAAQPKYAGGTGEAHDPYEITTATDLIMLGECPEDYVKHFILTADLDLDPNLPGGKRFDKAVIAPDTAPDEPNFQGAKFTGVLDGRGHTISHLTIAGGGYLGLFGYMDSTAKISNLGLEAVSIRGTGNRVGALAGQSDGVITASHGAGMVRGGSDVGGLVGHNRGGVVACSNTGTVWGEARVGGLVGENAGASGRSQISRCHSGGTVIGFSDVGGLVGRNKGETSRCHSRASVTNIGYQGGTGGLVGTNTGRVSESYGTGSVSWGDLVGDLVGDNEGIVTTSYGAGQAKGRWFVGGLVGRNQGRIAASYSSGTVNGEKSVGGLVGYNGGAITRCYTSGKAVGKWSAPGGLAGLGGKGGETTGCFWDIDATGLTHSRGGTGKATTAMQTAAIFLEANWDFVDETENGTKDIWRINESKDYPRLWWEPREEDGRDTAKD